MRPRLGIFLAAIGIVAGLTGSVEATQKAAPAKSIAELGCEGIHSSCAGRCGPSNASCNDACQRCHATCNQKLTLCLLDVASKKKSSRKTHRPAGGGVERGP